MSLRAKFLLWGQNRIEKGASFLAPLSFFWAVVSFCKNALYDRGWLRPLRVQIPVISVGNLVAGGTGKTPLVHLIASRLQHRKIAILSRSYGAYPDEPLLLQRRVPQAKIYVGKDRRLLARRAEEEGADLILLDDGFQYRKLYRELDLLLLAGSDPFGRGHFLPWGFLRDHPNRLKMADTIFISGESKRLFSFPHIHLKLRVDRILTFKEEEVLKMRGLQIATFCGISKPALFRKTVEDLGGKIVAELVLADHEKPSKQVLKEFAMAAAKKGASAVVCTEKDYVKWMDDPDAVQEILPFWFLEVSLHVARGADLWENLIAKIDQKVDNLH